MDLSFGLIEFSLRKHLIEWNVSYRDQLIDKDPVREN